MTTERLANLLLEVLILGVVVTILLTRNATPKPQVISMPQTITHQLDSGEVTTPRIEGESISSWFNRHQEAIDASLTL